MRRAVASLCLCWLAYCGARHSLPPNTLPPNTLPLAFGMTPKQASAALGVPLAHLSGRGGSQIYIATGLVNVPGYYPVNGGMALQFRRGRLTGWKEDWLVRRPPPVI